MASTVGEYNPADKGKLPCGKAVGVTYARMSIADLWIYIFCQIIKMCFDLYVRMCNYEACQSTQ